ncbi:MAG: hypothetical protein ACON4U_02155, partial [Myxococcota bacterium]
MYLKSTQTILLFSLLTACTEEENIKNSTSTDPTSDWTADADDTGDTDDTGDIDDTGDTGDTDTGDEDPADLALAGHWADNWGSYHMIDNVLWDSGWALYNITQYDNESGWIIAQNDVTNFYNPELWSKFEWTTDDDGEFYYCQSAYAEADEQAAIDASGADASDLATGCGGFGWTQMRPFASFFGSYDDSWGSQHTVSAFKWSSSGGNVHHISQYDDEAGWIIAQNDSSNAYSPDLWSKFELTADTSGALYYCQSAYAEVDEQAAIDAPGADSTDLTAGCGGFGWTALRNTLPLTGSWVDNYGGNHAIDAFGWTMDYGSFHISQADSSMGWLVAQNDSNNGYNPDLWSKFEWTTDSNGEYYYCQSAYAEVDEQAAIDAPGADATDLTAGCGGFGWSALRNILPLTGSWVDNYGGNHAIDAFSWTMDYGSFHISQADSSMGWLVAQNDSNNGYNPDLWSKFEW